MVGVTDRPLHLFFRVLRALGGPLYDKAPLVAPRTPRRLCWRSGLEWPPRSTFETLKTQIGTLPLNAISLDSSTLEGMRSC